MNKQTVYLPLKIENPTDKSFDVREGYFFTPEQLNELLSSVIKNTLETAAEEAEITYVSEWSDHMCVDKRTIRNTFDITFQKYKV